MSSLCAPKISEVLQILSEQPDAFDNCENACAVIRSRDNRAKSKQIFTDAVNYCMLLLSKTDRLTNYRSEVLSDDATLMGHEMFERIISVDVQMDVETEDESLSNDLQQRQIKIEPQDYFNGFSNIHIQAYSLATEETTSMTSPPSSPSYERPVKNIENSSTPSTDRPSRLDRTCIGTPRGKTIKDFFSPSNHLASKIYTNDFDDKQLPPSPVSLTGNDDTGDISEQQKSGRAPRLRGLGVPLETKMKIVALAKAHPKWNLKKLQEKGSLLLRTMDQLKQWERQINNGGTRRDKYWRIHTKTYERFAEARAKSQRVTAEILRKWAVQVARELYGTSFRFDASLHWFLNFKKAYGLQHDNTVNSYFKRDETIANQTMEELRSLSKSQRVEKENRNRFK